MECLKINEEELKRQVNLIRASIKRKKPITAEEYERNRQKVFEEWSRMSYAERKKMMDEVFK